MTLAPSIEHGQIQQITSSIKSAAKQRSKNAQRISTLGSDGIELFSLFSCMQDMYASYSDQRQEEITQPQRQDYYQMIDQAEQAEQRVRAGLEHLAQLYAIVGTNASLEHKIQNIQEDIDNIRDELFGHNEPIDGNTTEQLRNNTAQPLQALQTIALDVEQRMVQQDNETGYEGELMFRSDNISGPEQRYSTDMVTPPKSDFNNRTSSQVYQYQHRCQSGQYANDEMANNVQQEALPGRSWSVCQSQEREVNIDKLITSDKQNDDEDMWEVKRFSNHSDDEDTFSARGWQHNAHTNNDYSTTRLNAAHGHEVPKEVGMPPAPTLPRLQSNTDHPIAQSSQQHGGSQSRCLPPQNEGVMAKLQSTTVFSNSIMDSQKSNRIMGPLDTPVQIKTRSFLFSAQKKQHQSPFGAWATLEVEPKTPAKRAVLHNHDHDVILDTPRSKSSQGPRTRQHQAACQQTQRQLFCAPSLATPRSKSCDKVRSRIGPLDGCVGFYKQAGGVAGATPPRKHEQDGNAATSGMLKTPRALGPLSMWSSNNRTSMPCIDAARVDATCSQNDAHIQRKPTDELSVAYSLGDKRDSSPSMALESQRGTKFAAKPATAPQSSRQVDVERSRHPLMGGMQRVPVMTSAVRVQSVRVEECEALGLNMKFTSVQDLNNALQCMGDLCQQRDTVPIEELKRKLGGRVITHLHYLRQLKRVSNVRGVDGQVVAYALR